eukprot:CAMPEP_0172595692 /NCGR_PEP_ID=MMETSP1068-20121228/15308_1 /TAXON_ID=35684 /ORGANISM="Pseudopedinella elastica, Strain CCMP716" /LENGTH=164 /DNA_ID=CAMNT_0013394337 /DNA_START=8 /DNA_END=502 /DNA_ORIENTATION=+
MDPEVAEYAEVAKLPSASKHLDTIKIERHDHLLEILDQLPEQDYFTVFHFITDWTAEITSSNLRQSELETILMNSSSVVRYVRVTGAKAAARVGITIVPTFWIFRGRDKVDECTGADLSLFRACLDMNDTLRQDTPLLIGTPQGPFPNPTGSFLPIFDRGPWSS